MRQARVRSRQMQEMSPVTLTMSILFTLSLESEQLLPTSDQQTPKKQFYL